MEENCQYYHRLATLQVENGPKRHWPEKHHVILEPGFKTQYQLLVTLCRLPSSTTKQAAIILELNTHSYNRYMKYLCIFKSVLGWWIANALYIPIKTNELKEFN